jgi:hypothetical protein
MASSTSGGQVEPRAERAVRETCSLQTPSSPAVLHLNRDLASLAPSLELLISATSDGCVNSQQGFLSFKSLAT